MGTTGDPTGYPGPLPPPKQPCADAVEEAPLDQPQDEPAQDAPESSAFAGEHYLADDAILPVLTLDNPSPIRITITADRVSLSVGPRDWGWQRGCPDLSDAGTMLNEPVADE